MFDLPEIWPRDSWNRIETTYSFWQTFMTCRKKCFYRYGLGLVRKKEDRGALYIGSLVHRGLDAYYKNNRNEQIAKRAMREEVLKTDLDDASRLHLARAEAMLEGYHRFYQDDTWMPQFVEACFSGPIYNMATGRISRSLSLSGKIDLGACPFKEGRIWLYEHKTCEAVGEELLQRIWTQFQTKLYYAYFRFMNSAEVDPTDYNVEGIIYNWLGKTRIRARQGETEAEFLARKAALEAKTGKKSRAKQQIPSTPEEIHEKVLEELTGEPRKYFHREQVLFDTREIQVILRDLWSLTKDFLACQKESRWYQNTDSCFKWGHPCPYYPICSSGGNPNIIHNQYEVLPANQELKET